MSWHLASSEGGFNWWVLAGFLAFLVILIILARVDLRWSQKRERELPCVAKRLGLDFQPDPDAALAFQWCMIDDAFSRGDNRYAENIFRGTINGFPVVAFDHHHEAQDTDKHLHHYYDSVLIVILPKGIKAIEVLPESLATTLSQPLGME
ncbi:MAG: hypothetical protein AAB370_03305, partial [Verrucomicrobiota bacterium]